MQPHIPWELVADPLGSAEHTLGTTALDDCRHRHSSLYVRSTYFNIRSIFVISHYTILPSEAVRSELSQINCWRGYCQSIISAVMVRTCLVCFDLCCLSFRSFYVSNASAVANSFIYCSGCE